MTRGPAIAGKHRQEDAHKHGMGHSANLAYIKSDNPNSVRDKRKYSRMYEIVASALPWLKEMLVTNNVMVPRIRDYLLTHVELD